LIYINLSPAFFPSGNGKETTFIPENIALFTGDANECRISFALDKIRPDGCLNSAAGMNDSLLSGNTFNFHTALI
jgi:hypothetical protein